MVSIKPCAVLVLMTMLITFSPACKNQENAGSRQRPIQFYTGQEIEPVHTKSYVEKAHSKYTFEPVLQGDIIKHDFIITNNSTQEAMELEDAEGCCGLFVSNFSPVIPPELKGRISVLILTDSRGGETIDGTVRAKTSDPDRPEITIDVSIHVKEFADLNPYRIWLKGSPDTEIVENCIVVPNENYPFNITDIKTRKGVWFEFDWKEIQKDGKKAYEITLRNTRQKPGPYQDVLFVQTDHPDRPEFKIRVEGRIAR